MAQPPTEQIRAKQEPRRQIDASVDVSIVVPTYQAGERLPVLLTRLVAVLRATGRTFEVIVVDDASTDGWARRISMDGVTIVHRDRNGGKGAAIRTGFATARGQLIGFIDGDGQYDPSYLVPLMALCDQGWDIALGQRFDAAAQVSYSARRSLGSMLMLGIIHTLVDPALSETQAGIKVFRAEVVDAVLPRVVCDGFAIDVELLAWAKALRFRRHAVHPIRFNHDGHSTVTAWRAARMVVDLVGIRLRIRTHEVHELGARRRGPEAAWGNTSRGRDERQAYELLSHAARLAALGETTTAAAIELLSRARGDHRRLERAVRIAESGSRRDGDEMSPAVELLLSALDRSERIHGLRIK